MYKTAGTIDKKFYDSIKWNLLPNKGIAILKICVAVISLCYILFAFIFYDFFWACMSVIIVSLYIITFKIVAEKHAKRSTAILQEKYHTDSIEYCSEFTEDSIHISSNVREEMGYIYYSDLSTIFLTPKYYLIYTKAEQLICVFANQLQERDRLGLIGFLKEKAPKIKLHRERPKLKYIAFIFIILLYLSFAMFLYNSFVKTEAIESDINNTYIENSNSTIQENAAENEFSIEDTEIAEIPVIEINLQIENPSWEYYCKEEVIEAQTPSMRLELVNEEKNDITDVDIWVQENNLSIPGMPYQDEKYFYDFTGVFYEISDLIITDITDANRIYQIDFSDFTDGKGYVEYVKIEDHILYVSTGHGGYTADNPRTGYLTAIDLESGEVLWKTAPQISNAYNFEIVGDTIICGYGFTDEDDYLYVLNKSNGQVLEQIPLKTMAEYIIVKDSTLYVRTYNRNYEFAIWGS